MKKVKLIYCFLLTSLFVSPVSCQKNTSTVTLNEPSNINEAIENSRIIIRDLLDEYPGVSIAVGIRDSIVWSEGFGYADVSKNKEVNSNHNFRYYSLSKSITGIALIKLIESGKLDVEKPIQNYLPQLPQTYKNVKVKHLIAHTAGVRGYNKGEWLKISQNSCSKPSDAYEVFINDPLIAEPGFGDKYSSFGYVILSDLIESISGKSYFNYVNEVILEPLNINSIHLDQSIANSSIEVSYYEKWSLKKKSGKQSRKVNNSCKFGAGGFVGNAQDFVKLQLAMLNSQITNKELSEMYFKSFKNSNNEIVKYAYGVGDRYDEELNTRYHSHSGSGLGGNAVFLTYPNKRLVVVLLGNIENKEMNKKIELISEQFYKF